MPSIQLVDSFVNTAIDTIQTVYTSPKVVQQVYLRRQQQLLVWQIRFTT